MMKHNVLILLLSYFTRQATCKYLSIRNSSHESKLRTAVSLNSCSLADYWHMPFLKQTIKNPNKAKDGKGVSRKNNHRILDNEM